MKPSERFAKRVWRKPPKNNAKTLRTSNKTGTAKCAICKEIIPSSKQRLLRKNFKPAKSSIRTNKPYGGHICNKCLRQKAIDGTRALE
ncbi:MAG: hypothetical protein JXA54_08990 [Candidatus Heimdallarchaeota archaeon]|nr:hypothetical protein [Candidatus Heimdallarchaeota archaeon]